MNKHLDYLKKEILRPRFTSVDVNFARDRWW